MKLQHLSRSFLIALFLGFSSILPAQSVVIQNDIPVLGFSGDTVDNPWAGGLNKPQFWAIDLDNDATKDLVLFDRMDDRLIPMMNAGMTGSVDYTFDHSYISNFPSGLNSWIVLADFNGDGYEDLFTGSLNSSIAVYENDGFAGGSLNFNMLIDTLHSQYDSVTNSQLVVSYGDMPSIADVDNDGDLDILTFDGFNLYVEWHKNVSVDSGWGLDSLVFVKQSGCYGHFFELGPGCVGNLDTVPCGPGERLGYIDPKPYIGDPKAAAHAGSSLLSMDLNGDNLMDLVVGDVGCYSMYALYNAGDTLVADFDSVEANFPQSDVPVDIPLFNEAFFLDLDNDGTKDFVAAPSIDGLGSDDLYGVWYYKNNGTPTMQDINFMEEGFLQSDMIEWGTGASPAMLDYNNDGLMDLVVGNRSYYDALWLDLSGLALYENIGTATSPAFQLVDSNFADIPGAFFPSNKDYHTPAFGDLDADGDMDMFIGEKFGRCYYFENTAAPGADASFTYRDMMFTGVDAGGYSAPFLYDLDGDNDLDLISGDQDGEITLWINTGDSSAASFGSPASTTWGFVDIDMTEGVGSTDGFSKPVLFDYDGDMEVELLVGGADGYIDVFEDVSISITDTFTYAGRLIDYDFGRNSGIGVAQGLDSTSNAYYFIGGDRGGLESAYGTIITSAEGPAMLEEDARMQVYPNPANTELHLQFINIAANDGMDISIYNQMGQMVQKTTTRKNGCTVNVSTLSPGVYLVEARNATHRFVERVVVR